jgi:hypothetical protein
MRSKVGFNNADLSILLPRIYDIDIQTLGYFFRWGFTADELVEASLREMTSWDLSVEIRFKLDRKKHRRMEFTNLANKSGWLQARLLCVLGDQKSYYLLTSCFDDLGTRVEFRTMDSLFDHVTGHEALDYPAPQGVMERTGIEMETQEEMSLSHWKSSQLKLFRKAEKAESNQVQKIEDELEEVKQQLKSQRDQLVENGSSLATKQIELLKAQRTELRASLLIAESKENETESSKFAKNSYSHDIAHSNLFTMRWRVEASK